MKRSRVSLVVLTGTWIAAISVPLACGTSPTPTPDVAKPKPAASETSSAAAAPTAAPSASASAAQHVDPPKKEEPKESVVCGWFRKNNEERFEQVIGSSQGGGCAPQFTHAGCVTKGSLTWGYELLTVEAKGSTVATSAASEKVGCVTTSEYKLVRVDSGGRTTVAKGNQTLHNFGGNPESVELQVLSDYDKDGEAEILKTFVRNDADGNERPERSLLTYKSGTIAPYAPAKAIVIDSAEDIDHDGLVDLVTKGPYASFIAMHGTEKLPLGPAIFAWHALADGKFSMNDKEAQAFTRSKCPSKQEHPLEAGKINGGPETPQAVVCARLWGVTALQISADWKTACGSKTDDERNEGGCWDYPKNLAFIAPPFQL